MFPSVSFNQLMSKYYVICDLPSWDESCLAITYNTLNYSMQSISKNFGDDLVYHNTTGYWPEFFQ